MSVYDPATDTWADNVDQGTNPPTARYDHASWGSDGLFYIALGSATPMWVFDPNGSSQKWTQLSTPSYNKSFAKAFVVPSPNGKVVYFIGANGGASPSEMTYKYNMVQQTWSYGLDRLDAGVPISCLVDKKIFLFGTYYGTGDGVYKDHIGYFDTDSEKVVSLCGSEGTWIGRSNHTMAFKDHCVYVSGGFVSGNQRYDYGKLQNGAVWEANIDNSSFKLIASEGSPRISATMNFIGEDLYIVGGHNNTCNLNRVSVFNMLNKSWSYAAPLPLSVRCHTSAVYKGKLYVFGGDATGSAGIQDRLWQYDPSTNIWTELASGPARLNGSESYVYGDKLYVLFGYNQSSAYSDSMYVYDFVLNSWSTVSINITEQGRPSNSRYNFASWGRGQYWYITGDEAASRPDVWYVDLKTLTWVRSAQDVNRGDIRGVKAACDPETGRAYLVGGPNNSAYWPTPEMMTCYL
jgi:hypothetical protein